MDASEHAFIATAMAIAVGIVKVLEKTFDWMSKRSRGGDDKTVKLDAETIRLLRESNNRVENVDRVVGRVDQDGIPMVYTPRTYLDNQLKMTEALRDISQNMGENTGSLTSIQKKIDEILTNIKKQ